MPSSIAGSLIKFSIRLVTCNRITKIRRGGICCYIWYGTIDEYYHADYTVPCRLIDNNVTTDC